MRCSSEFSAMLILSFAKIFYLSWEFLLATLQIFFCIHNDHADIRPGNLRIHTSCGIYDKQR